MATKPFFFDVPKVSTATIANSDASNLKTVVTGATNGSKVTGLNLATDDTTTRDVQIGVTKNGGSFVPLGTINVPITAGTIAAAPSVNGFDTDKITGLSTDSDGVSFIHLESGDTLQMKSLTTVTSGKKIYAVATHGDDA